MSGATANNDVDSHGWGGGAEAAGRGDAAVSADAVGEHRRAHDAGVDVRAACARRLGCPRTRRTS